MLAFALGLGTALCWGLADFLGGMQTKVLAVLSVTALSQLAGLVAAVAVALAAGGEPPPVTELWPAAVAGIAAALALMAFYTGLAIGTMSIVSPISATGAILPVVVGLLAGEDPGTVTLIGIAVAVCGVVLASREEDLAEERPGVARRSIPLALLAALGFGSFFVGMDAAAGAGVLWALVAARVASVTMLLGICAARRSAPSVPRERLAAVVLIGLLDTAANGLFAWGTTLGLLSVVAVLASLYPVTTVLLARAVLGERIRAIQGVGVAGALVGVVLIAV